MILLGFKALLVKATKGISTLQEADHTAADLALQLIHPIGSNSSLRKKNYREEEVWKTREDRR